MPAIEPSEDLKHKAIYDVPEGLNSGIEENEIPRHVQVVNSIMALFKRGDAKGISVAWFENPGLSEVTDDGRLLVVEYNLTNQIAEHLGHLLSMRVRVADPGGEKPETVRVQPEAYIGARRAVFDITKYGNTMPDDDASRQLDGFYPGVVAEYHKSISDGEQDFFAAVSAESDRFVDIEDTLDLVIEGASESGLSRFTKIA